MSDLPAKKFVMKDPLDGVVAKFTVSVKAMVAELWPQLVAIELMKLKSKPAPRVARDRNQLIADIKRMQAQKMSQAQIGRELGLTAGYISRVARSADKQKEAA